MSPTKARVCIIGAGAAGLALAHALSSRAIELLICDAGKAGQGAIAASAGMIAADAEAAESLDPSSPAHRAFHSLARHSAQMWPLWSETLLQNTGIDVQYRRSGVLVPGDDTGHAARMAAQAGRFAIAARRALAEDAPGYPLAPGALFLPGEARLDPRVLARALQHAVCAAGARILEDSPVERLVSTGGRITGVQLASGDVLNADAVVIAAGWAAARLHACADGLVPVKGQILRLDTGGDTSRWPVVRGDGVYIVPASGGHVLAGASVEPGLDDTRTDTATRDALMAQAGRLHPDAPRWRLVDHWAGVRPAFPDRMPRVGEAAPGLFVCLGGHRNGILLAPALAEGLAREITGEGRDAHLAPFAPGYG